VPRRAAGELPVVRPKEFDVPRNKDFKRLVRARMNKTGESYTAARVHILKSRRHALRAPVSTATVASVSLRPKPDLAALAGMSDAAIKAKTGCTWERWVYALDRQGAQRLSHTEIARLVSTKYRVGPWWTQAVAVGYERIKGLRARGQQRNGTYQMTKSRTFNVPVSVLFHAWSDARLRRRWLDGTDVRVRTATASKSMRLDWPDGGIVALGFFAKGKAKSAVALEHTKLSDRASADSLKQYWAERLDALGDVLREP
jgi:hypothetical protein